MHVFLFLLLHLTFVYSALYHLQPVCSNGMKPLSPYLTQDFQEWLSANNFSEYNFVRSDLPGGSFGGRTAPGQLINNTPIVFIHGNSDEAIGNGTIQNPWQTGFRDLIQFLINNSYTEAELYITTWGPADPQESSEQAHTWEYVNYLRQFLNAVINYTNSSQIHVVAHEMGVTLARKAIKGGNMSDIDGTSHYVGESLQPNINTFLGLAGANWGILNCEYLNQYPYCGESNGFYPGSEPGTDGIPVDLGGYLADINTSDGVEASFIATMWAYPYDSVIGQEDIFNRNTSQISYENASMMYNGFMWTSYDIRDGACQTVLNVLTNHKFNEEML